MPLGNSLNLDSTTQLKLLSEGYIEIVDRLPYTSNNAFIVSLSIDEITTLGVYKPEVGERPLWDFDEGLWRREVCAYLLSNSLGWDIVPTTVAREDGPVGVGSIQQYIQCDEDSHYFNLVCNEIYLPQLLKIAVFDLIVNNADRKGGHFLLDENGVIYGIDHGLCFNVEPKLRTVMWDFGGAEIPPQMKIDLSKLKLEIETLLLPFLEVSEVEATKRRLEVVSELTHFIDIPEDKRPYPWPVI